MSTPKRILLVEDDGDIAEVVALHLRDEGYAVEHAVDGTAGLTLLEREAWDAIVLDLMLPGIDGLELCRRTRAMERYTPIIITSARGSEVHRVLGLEIGADDYVTKPFSPKELMARIKAVFRRRAPQLTEDVVAINGLKLDPSTHRVAAHAQGSEIKLDLGPTEFRLLHFFMTHPERVHSRTQLLDQVWGDHVFVEERTVDVHIKRLRAALKPAGCDAMIETVRGSGYRLAKSA